MFLARQNPKGARPLQGYPMVEDSKTGQWGYKIGYCLCGCQEPILIRTVELRDVVDYFGYSDGYCDHKEEKKLFHSPIPAIKKRIVESLGGTYS